MVGSGSPDCDASCDSPMTPPASAMVSSSSKTRSMDCTPPELRVVGRSSPAPDVMRPPLAEVSVFIFRCTETLSVAGPARAGHHRADFHLPELYICIVESTETWARSGPGRLS